MLMIYLMTEVSHPGERHDKMMLAILVSKLISEISHSAETPDD